MPLVIVESPTKARTLSRFLGSNYRIQATMGHIRDLPQKRLGVNINNNFEPTYTVLPKRKELVLDLKKAAYKKTGNTLILATDPDREGEAIAWHIKEAITSRLSKKEKEKKIQFLRIAFHEITKEAIESALLHPRDINVHLVDSQQGRRILDRLVGYKLSPILWYKTGKNWLSAGRVQSVAVRLIVEREQEIEAFKSEEYWIINAKLKVQNSKIKEEEKIITAELVKIDEKRAEVKDKKEADAIVSDLEKQTYKIADVRENQARRSPPPPFTTATMQRAGSNLFGWSAKRTMMIAQSLYEEGFITYHRTDSLNIAESAMKTARDFILKTYGGKYLPENPRFYKTKSRLAQEAHEAIRPTDVSQDQISSSQKELGRDNIKLLDLITKRFVASQMNDEEVLKTTVDITAGERYLFQAKGERVLFEGWKVLYKEDYKLQMTNDKSNTKFKIQNKEIKDEQESILPAMVAGEILELLKILPEQKFTQPPARYNEASLIKTLEEKGIGRPSTYAPIISTIQQRQYVEKIDRRYLKPTELGIMVNKFLVDNFADIVDVFFTAKMEEELDDIAHGKTKWVKVIADFWAPFSAKLAKVKEDKQKVKMKVETVDEKCPKDGGQLVIRLGRYGKFLACGNFPNCKFTKQLVEKINIPCSKCGGDVIVRRTKKGRHFFGCSNYPKCKFASWTKPEANSKSE